MGLFISKGVEYRNNSKEEEKYYCDACGKEISKERYFENGKLDN